MTTPSHPLGIVLYAKDAPQLVSFYEAVLGLRREEEGPTYVLLASDHIELAIVQASEAIAGHIEIASPPALRESTPIKASFLVPDIEALRQRIHELGGGLQPPDAAWSWRGVRHLDGWDPEGNVLQLRQG